MKIFVLNVGSSTYKCALFDVDAQADAKTLWKETKEFGQNPNQTLAASIEEVLRRNTTPIEAVGHRVVHGGEHYQKPVLITETVKDAIRKYASLAPLHNLENLAGIEAVQKLLPAVPHVAVFDTAFHSTLPDYAFIYPLPLSLRDQGIRRYGFHGISHEYCSKQAAMLLNKNLSDLKIVTCHLGNGSSLAAISGGYSIDTTMGFTPMEGVMMGTRCGSIDPGILLYLLQTNKITADDLDYNLNYESGLKGICGYAGLKEVLEQRQSGNPNASLAFEMLNHSLIKNIGSMIAVLGGVDALVFAGGIGENSPELRAKVCEKLHAEIDPAKNEQRQGDREITLPHAKIKVLVIYTREDLAIAQACFGIVT